MDALDWSLLWGEGEAVTELGELAAQISKIMGDVVSNQSEEHLSFNFTTSSPDATNSQAMVNDSSFQLISSFDDIESICGSDSGSSTSRQRNGDDGSSSLRRIAEKKRKHLDLEVRRRQRMNDNYQELYTLCKPTRKDQASILECASDRLQIHNSQIYSLLSSLTPNCSENFNI
jgi:hypothetical protein